MTDDRQPDYDFFLAQPSSPPGAAPAGPPPEPATVHGVGTTVHPGWTQTGYGNYPEPPPRRGLPNWVIALIATAGALFILAILAAVAIPVFLNQRAKAEWQATKVAMPAAVAGTPRTTGAGTDAIVQSMVGPGVKADDIGVYGEVGPSVVILYAVKSPKEMNELSQANERRGFLKGSAAAGATLTLVKEKDAGSLGGWFGCAQAQADVTICLATDRGALFAAVMGPSVANPAQVARQAREATVKR